MTNVNTVTETGSMPISMAVGSNPNQSATSEVATATMEAKPAAKPEQKKDRVYFSRAIHTASITMYRSVKAVSDLLFEARLALSPEDFRAFIEEDCPFDYTQVCKFIKMAADYRLNDPANDPILPEAWTARYEIMLMKEATFRIGVKSGNIHSNCTLADLKKLREQVEGKKSKKAASKKTDSAPKATTEATPLTQQAALKATVNTSALKGVGTATGVATAPAKGRIAIVLGKALAEQHKVDLDHLKQRIEALVKEYVFIGVVELEVAA